MTSTSINTNEVRTALSYTRDAYVAVTVHNRTTDAREFANTARAKLTHIADEFIPGPYVPGANGPTPITPINDARMYVNAAVTMLDQHDTRNAVEYLDSAINELEHHLRHHNED